MQGGGDAPVSSESEVRIESDLSYEQEWFGGGTAKQQGQPQTGRARRISD